MTTVGGDGLKVSTVNGEKNCWILGLFGVYLSLDTAVNLGN